MCVFEKDFTFQLDEHKPHVYDVFIAAIYVKSWLLKKSDGIAQIRSDYYLGTFGQY